MSEPAGQPAERPRSCYNADQRPKAKFPSMRRAKEHARKHQYPYKCPNCPYWHLATTPHRGKLDEADRERD